MRRVMPLVLAVLVLIGFKSSAQQISEISSIPFPIVFTSSR